MFGHCARVISKSNPFKDMIHFVEYYFATIFKTICHKISWSILRIRVNYQSLKFVIWYKNAHKV